MALGLRARRPLPSASLLALGLSGGRSGVFSVARGWEARTERAPRVFGLGFGRAGKMANFLSSKHGSGQSRVPSLSAVGVKVTRGGAAAPDPRRGAARSAALT